MKQEMKQEYQKILISCFTSCFKIGLASHLLHNFCNVNAWSNVRKVVFHEPREKHAKKENQNGSTARGTTFWGSEKIPSFMQ